MQQNIRAARPCQNLRKDAFEIRFRRRVPLKQLRSARFQHSLHDRLRFLRIAGDKRELRTVRLQRFGHYAAERAACSDHHGRAAG
jgi:hypothetical protein